MLPITSLLSATFLGFCLNVATPVTDSHNAVLIFSSDEKDAMALRQEAILDRDIPGLAERDMLVSVITPASDARLYKETVAPGCGFMIVLITSDGVKKFQSVNLVKSEELYRIVDNRSKEQRPVDRLENKKIN